MQKKVVKSRAKKPRVEWKARIKFKNKQTEEKYNKRGVIIVILLNLLRSLRKTTTTRRIEKQNKQESYIEALNSKTKIVHQQNTKKNTMKNWSK